MEMIRHLRINKELERGRAKELRKKMKGKWTSFFEEDGIAAHGERGLVPGGNVHDRRAHVGTREYPRHILRQVIAPGIYLQFIIKKFIIENKISRDTCR